MIFPEREFTHEIIVGDTRYIVISEAPADTRRDVLDALTALMVKDYKGEFAETD